MTANDIIWLLIGVRLGFVLGAMFTACMKHSTALELRMAHHARENDDQQT